jgi:enoyl-CoA hydratase/carnithine racemase
MVDAVVPREQGMPAAIAMAERVARRGPLATQASKMLINAAEGEETERVLEALAGAVAAASDELKEGLAAFRGKRPPSF